MGKGGSRGIDIVTGGGRVTVEGCEAGYFLAPTILDNVPRDHRLAQEETLSTFKTEEESIDIANGTPYGLVAGIWTPRPSCCECTSMRRYYPAIWRVKKKAASAAKKDSKP